VVGINNPTWLNYPAVHIIGWTYGAYGVAGGGNTVVGSYYCHTGWRTAATTCGYALAGPSGGACNPESVTYSSGATIGAGQTISHPCLAFYNGMCARPGDSGGPVFDPSTLVGVAVIVGAPAKNPDGAACGSQGAEFSVAEPVTSIGGRYGLSVNHI
jgi:hypothetical protein